MPNRSDQRGARASGDVVGRDSYKTTNINLMRHQQIRELVNRLSKEIERDERQEEWIESLGFFEEPYAPDGVVGLEAKLQKCGRPDKIPLAIRHKELFVKFLNKYALYGAAQELLALCLHRIHVEFEAHVHPVCGEAPVAALDQIISSKIINAVVQEYGLGAFALNHGLVLGMTYWLAERCYVRWHA